MLQRQAPCRPKLNWADRALLAILPGVIPKARRHRLRLLVTPDTILRWHRNIVRRCWAAKSICGKSGRPATRRNIKTLDYTTAFNAVLADAGIRTVLCNVRTPRMKPRVAYCTSSGRCVVF